MKKLIAAIVLMAAVLVCISQSTKTPIPQRKVKLPYPPGWEEWKAKHPQGDTSAVPAVVVVPVLDPQYPYVARMTEIIMTNLEPDVTMPAASKKKSSRAKAEPRAKPTDTVIIKYDLQISSFGVAYSDNLTTWTTIGESRWTNPTTNNPFLKPGTTEHTVWVGTPQWQVTHRADGLTTNQWKLILIDSTAPNQRKRFYKITPLGPVTGLPYPS